MFEKEKNQKVGSSASRNGANPGERRSAEGSMAVRSDKYRDSNRAHRKRTPSFLVQAARPAVIPASTKKHG